MDPASLAVQLGITFGLRALQWWLSTPPPDERPKRFSEEPTTHEGDPMPLTYGMCRVTRPIFTWHSDNVDSVSIDDLSNSSGIEVGGMANGLNMLFNLGMVAGPVTSTAHARLLGFYVGEDKLEMNLAHNAEMLITPADLSLIPLPIGSANVAANFNTSAGDIFGWLQFFAGTSTQAISDNDPATSNLDDITQIGHEMRRHYSEHLTPDPELIPGFRGQMLVALSGSRAVLNLGSFYFLAGDGTFPPFSFEVASRWSLFGTIQGNGDANPVDVIYDILTNPWGRLGISPALIDTVTFTAAAATLDTEQWGFSYCFDSTTSGHDAIRMVVDHAGCALFYDPVANLIKIKLIRNDYNASTCPSFDARHVDSKQPPEYRIGGWKNTTNVVEVKYTDRVQQYQEASVIRQNQASAVVQGASATDGRLRTVTISYPGCSYRDLAVKLADRDLSYLSQPMATIRITLNRLVDVHGTSDASDLRPGDVFKLDLPDYNISGMLFRVERIDSGQLGDNRITIDATQDPFWIAGTDVDDPFDWTTYIATPNPVNHRRIDEAPRFLQLKAAEVGYLTSVNDQHIWGLAAPDDNGITYRVQSAASTVFSEDVFEVGSATRFTWLDPLSRENEPYDASTPWPVSFGSDHAGFVTNLVTDIGSISLPTDISEKGRWLLILDDEIMAFEAIADLGSGQANISGLWRGLLDTPAVAHAADSVGWLIGTNFGGRSYVGRRVWPQLAGVSARTMARLGFIVGSGGDPSDTIDFRLRTLRQYPVANLALAGEMAVGTQGLPTQAATAPALGYFKSISLLEEDISHVAYKTRDKNNTTILRGDASSEDPTDVVVGGTSITWRLSAQKGDAAEVTLADAIADDGNSGARLHALLGPAGHGSIDVIMHTVKTTPAGKYGVPPATSVVDEWDAPRIPVVAPHWRNLLANARFSYDYDDSLASIGNGIGIWHKVTSTPTRAQSTSSLTRDAAGWYALGGSTLGTCAFEQVIDVSGYLPRAMNATLWWYFRNLSADADDTITVDFIALDASNGVLATQSIGPVAGSTTLWRKLGLAHSTLPANTAKLKIKVTLTPVGGGDTTANVAFTEALVNVGNFLDDVLLTPSFDAGIGSWTNVTNSFAYPTTIPFANRNGTGNQYAVGGAFASSEIKQEYTIPTGREFGTFVLRFWRANDGTNDTGNVIVEALSGAAAVLATTSTGVEAMAVQNVWYWRRLTLNLPDGTVTVRVRLLANRAAGAGNSGAAFDDFHAQLHNDLDPSFTRELVLSAPSVQPMPATWQSWHTTFVEHVDAGIKAPLVIGPTTRASGSGWTSAPLKLRWSDDVDRDPNPFVGQWGGGIGSIDGTRFTRQSGAGALDVQSFAEVNGFRPACPRSTASFSVAVWLRIDEAGFSTACGVVGRADGSLGWEIALDATGHLQAVLRGALGTKTATRAGSTVIDGAVHLAVLVYDAVGQTLSIYDERGANSTSTAAGLGEFLNTTMTTPLRIGRSRSTIDTIPGFLSPVYYFNQALSAAQVRGADDSLWRYGVDPTGSVGSGRLTTNSRAQAVLVQGPRDDNDEDTLAILATDQVAFAYDANLTTFADDDVGDSMGLPLCRAHQNVIAKWDFTDSTWTVDSPATLTQGIVDVTGKPTAVRVNSSDTTRGIRASSIAMTATATLTVVCWVRSVLSAAPTFRVELQNSANVVKQTIDQIITKQWRKHVFSFTAWDNSTPTAKLRFLSGSGTFDFELSVVVFAQQGVEVPTMFTLTASTALAADVNVECSETFPLETNAQGEIVAEGVGTIVTPTANGTIASVNSSANLKNSRELRCSSAAAPVFDHRDTTPTNAASTATAIDWTQPWQLRGRWAYVKTLDVTANAYAGINVDGSVVSVNYGRTANFTYDSQADNRIQLGKGPSGNSAHNCLLRKIIVRAREEKLP